jgi:hypothetical protein
VAHIESCNKLCIYNAHQKDIEIDKPNWPLGITNIYIGSYTILVNSVSLVTLLTLARVTYPYGYCYSLVEMYNIDKKRKLELTNKGVQEPLKILRYAEDYNVNVGIEGYNPYWKYGEIISFFNVNRSIYPDVMQLDDIKDILSNLFYSQRDLCIAKIVVRTSKFSKVTHLTEAKTFYQMFPITDEVTDADDNYTQYQKIRKSVKPLLVKISAFPKHVLLQTTNKACRYTERCVYVAFVNMLMLLPPSFNSNTRLKDLNSKKYFSAIDHKLEEYGLHLQSLLDLVVPNNVGKPKGIDEVNIPGSVVNNIKRGGYSDDLKAFELAYQRISSRINRIYSSDVNKECDASGRRFSIHAIKRWLQQELSYPNQLVILATVWDNTKYKAKLDDLLEIFRAGPDERYIIIGNNSVSKTKSSEKDSTGRVQHINLYNSHGVAVVTYQGQKVIVNCVGDDLEHNICLLTPASLKYHFPFAPVSVHALRIRKGHKLEELEDHQGRVPWKTIFNN